MTASPIRYAEAACDYRTRVAEKVHKLRQQRLAGVFDRRERLLIGLEIAQMTGYEIDQALAGTGKPIRFRAFYRDEQGTEIELRRSCAIAEAVDVAQRFESETGTQVHIRRSH